MPINELLTPQARKLLVNFAREIRSPDNLDGLAKAYSGALLANKAGLLPPHGQYRADVCTQQDCVKAIHAIRQLMVQNLIVPTLPFKPQVDPPYERDEQWNWLFNNGFQLAEEGFVYADWLTSPWYGKAKNYFKQHAWAILAAISATVTLILFILHCLGYL